MHRRYQNLNIPTEILRSIVGISDAGSITKAATKLGLSQPAISAQLKRIESLVGGHIFLKTPTGSTTTELGKLVLGYARRILDANDQLLRLKGSSQKAKNIRLGVSSPYAQLILGGQCKAVMENASVYADASPEILKGLLSGFVDVGLFLRPPQTSMDPKVRILREQDEEVAWVRSRGFVLSPGAPIPLISWPGGTIDDLMIGALEHNEMSYRIAFSSPDYQAKIAAVEAGFGLTAIPRRMLPAGLICIHDYYLPALPDLKLFLCTMSADLDSSKLVKALTNEFFEPDALPRLAAT